VNLANLPFVAGGGDMGARIRAFDWSRTPLGPLSDWPQGLRTAVRIMLTSRQPIWVGWGEDLLYLYNDPYKSIVGGKHPYALGRPTKDVWREIWPEIGPMLATAMGGVSGAWSRRLGVAAAGFGASTGPAARARSGPVPAALQRSARRSRSWAPGCYARDGGAEGAQCLDRMSISANRQESLTGPAK
jgi:hypothetical protein